MTKKETIKIMNKNTVSNNNAMVILKISIALFISILLIMNGQGAIETAVAMCIANNVDIGAIMKQYVQTEEIAVC